MSDACRVASLVIDFVYFSRYNIGMPDKPSSDIVVGRKRKVGRPRRCADVADCELTVRLTRSEMDTLKYMAELQKRSVSDLVRGMLSLQ